MRSKFKYYVSLEVKTKDHCYDLEYDLGPLVQSEGEALDKVDNLLNQFIAGVRVDWRLVVDKQAEIGCGSSEKT